MDLQLNCSIDAYVVISQYKTNQFCFKCWIASLCRYFLYKIRYDFSRDFQRNLWKCSDINYQFCDDCFYLFFSFWWQHLTGLCVDFHCCPGKMSETEEVIYLFIYGIFPVKSHNFFQCVLCVCIACDWHFNCFEYIHRLVNQKCIYFTLNVNGYVDVVEWKKVMKNVMDWREKTSRHWIYWQRGECTTIHCK